MTARAPRWTTARLETALTERYGQSRRGGVDTRAVAEAMEVSRRTVQRWLSGERRRRPVLPEVRLAQVKQQLAPDELHTRRRKQNRDYAAAAVRRLARDPDDSLESWKRQGWLSEHLVAIVAVHDSRVRRVVTGRLDAQEFDDRTRRDGRVLTSVVVPTRFHATLLAEAVLEVVEPWQVRAHDGRTISWFDDAPPVILSRIAAQIEREVRGDE